MTVREGGRPRKPGGAVDAATPLRVLFVCADGFTGPSEKQVLGFAQALLRRGHGVMISVGQDSADAADEAGGDLTGLVVHRHRLVGHSLRPASGRAARAFRPSLVHAWNARGPAIAAALGYRRATGAPLLVHFEDDEWGLSGPAPTQRLRDRLVRGARRLAGQVHAPFWRYATPASLRTAAGALALDALTPTLAAVVEARLHRPCRTILPVLPDRFSGDPGPVPDLAAIFGRIPVIAYAGTVTEVNEADFRLGLRALARLQRDGLAVAFAQCGGVGPRLDADRMVRDAGLAPGSYRFLGYLPRAGVHGLLRTASVLMSPGRPTEYNRLRLPSKLQVYLASGVPTVTFAAGFGELLEDRVEVLKTYGGEVVELATRLAEALTDAVLRQILSAGGPRAAARLFDPDRNTDALVAHYRAGLARGTGAPSRPSVARGDRP